MILSKTSINCDYMSLVKQFCQENIILGYDLHTFFRPDARLGQKANVIQSVSNHAD